MSNEYDNKNNILDGHDGWKKTDDGKKIEGISKIEKLENDNIVLSEALKKAKDDLRKISIKLVETQNRLNECKEDKEDKEKKLEIYKKAYDNVIASKSWKITAPIRKLSMKAHAFLQPNNKSAIIKQHDDSAFVQKDDYIKNIDLLNVIGSTIHIKGWITNKVEKSIQVGFYVKSKEGSKTVLLSEFDKRPDVAEVHGLDHEECGFNIKLKINGAEKAEVYIVYGVNNQLNKSLIGKVELDSGSNSAFAVKLMSSTETEEIDKLTNNLYVPTDRHEVDYLMDQTTIDIIVPVYDGYEYLKKLFDGIKKAGMPYRLIVINDCSADPRVQKYLEEHENPNMILLNNETNIGFVKTVNRGLKLTENHVAILNTDIELPDGWLVPLMKPIIENEKVASTTPFTNSGTICSFPNFCKDCSIFMGLSVDTINQTFSKFPQLNIELPTGVGFCMGMNRHTIDDIGYFDSLSFEKGYGEENDWCMRAAEHGYTNVMVNNLFVYHKHGGSFLSEEKKKLQESNMNVLLKKHPSYLKKVSDFCEEDPTGFVRRMAEFFIILHNSTISTLVFCHALGGGAENYLSNKNLGKNAIIIRYIPDSNVFILNLNNKYENISLKYSFKSIQFLRELLSESNIETIIVNEIVSYPEVFDVLTEIIKIKEEHETKLVMLLHDYYCICPSLNLLDTNGVFCELPDSSFCNGCLANNKFSLMNGFKSIFEWRNHWSKFLIKCDEIRCFSEDSKKLYVHVYGDTNNLTVVPHTVEYMFPVKKRKRNQEKIVIGILGTLTEHKGLNIVKEILNLIDNGSFNVQIVLIGEATEKINSKSFIETGKYIPSEIPFYVCKHDIDLFLIPSVCPETFSYTTEEIIKMDIPVAVFDIGAPAERIKHYDKGLIISNIDAKNIMDALTEFYYDKIYNYQITAEPFQKVLFITDFRSFSSRYRVDHVVEELLIEGMASDFVTTDAVKVEKLKDYSIIVVYRCKYTERLSTFISEAKKYNIKIIYDIDDYVFDYKDISYLEFLKNDEYSEFETYTEDVFKMMNICDMYTTSTETLKKMIKDHFPGKEVKVIRNVASMEMKSLSLKALADSRKKSSDNSKVVLGYFSGSATHNMDFELIDNVIIEIMEKHNNVILLIGGLLELSKKFNAYQERIARFDILEWQDLPAKMTEVDINLMPLESSLFNQCKSENKWTEAALVKVPTIASYNQELHYIIEDGINGFLCKNVNEWREKIELLVTDAEIRKKIGLTAFNDVMNKHTTQNVSKNVGELYSRLN